MRSTRAADRVFSQIRGFWRPPSYLGRYAADFETTMTWYAQQVFAQPRPDTIAAFRAVPAFANSIYHVPHLRELETSEAVPDGMLLAENDGLIQLHRTVRRGPQIPADGLLVVRELCGADDDSNTAEWFGEDAVFWNDIGRDLEPLDDPVLNVSRVFADAPEWWPNCVPPSGVLCQLRNIAFATNQLSHTTRVRCGAAMSNACLAGSGTAFVTLRASIGELQAKTKLAMRQLGSTQILLAHLLLTRPNVASL